MTRWVAVCPRCGDDLDDEGLAFWCPTCHDAIPIADALPPDEALYDD